MKLFIITIVLAIITSKIYGQQMHYYLSAGGGYSGVRKVQDNLIPYFYDNKGFIGYGLAGGVKFKEVMGLCPIAEVSLFRYAHQMRHFVKTIDTLEMVFEENIYRFEQFLFSLNAKVRKAVAKNNLLISAGVGGDVLLKGSEEKATINIKDGKETVLTKEKRSFDRGKKISFNAILQMDIPLSDRTEFGIEGKYGLTFQRNDNSSDYLGRQIYFGIRLTQLIGK